MERRSYALVIGCEASPLERLGADELKAYGERITDIPIRLVKDDEAISDRKEDRIFVLGTAESNRLIAEFEQKGVVDLSESVLGEQGFRIKTIEEDGRKWLLLCGRKPIGAMYAVYHYLETYCGVGFFVDGERIPQQEALPFGEIDDQVKPHFEHRGYLVHPNWTRPYVHCCRLWSFADWKRLIDWMRRKRLNRLMCFHDEGTYMWGDAIFRAFPEIPKNSETLEKFVVDPEYRTELNQRIFQYARENGISVVYNFIYSELPDFFQRAHPEWTYHQLQMEDVGICASQPECKKVMRRFWGKIIETYGVDDSHLYVVCAYQHEVERCPHFPTSAPVARQAYEVLKEIDPKAQMFVETWCWGRYWLERDTSGEWRDFQALMPEDVGVLDWDSEFSATPDGEKEFGWYRPRPWMQLKHLSMETSYPPLYSHIKPQDLYRSFRQAADHGARGIWAFDIVARSHPMLSDLSAEMGWHPHQSFETLYRGYVRRRYGTISADRMEQSIEMYIQAVDSGIRLVAAETCFPAESELFEKVHRSEEHLKGWIEKRLQDFQSKYKCALRAQELALQEAANQRNNPFYGLYLWELNYLVARWEGCIAFYRAYRYAQADHEQAKTYFQEAVEQFYRIKDLFRDRPEYSMAKLEELGQGVKYLSHFVKNWNTIRRRWVDIRPYYDVVWEHFDRYEELLRRMAPWDVGK